MSNDYPSKFDYEPFGTFKYVKMENVGNHGRTFEHYIGSTKWDDCDAQLYITPAECKHELALLKQVMKNQTEWETLVRQCLASYGYAEDEPSRVVIGMSVKGTLRLLFMFKKDVMVRINIFTGDVDVKILDFSL